jgi:N-methylhydantoinase A
MEREEIFFAPFIAAPLNALLNELEKKARDSMWEMGRSPGEVEIERYGLLRYSGQWLHSLLVRIPDGELTSEGLDGVVGEFRSMYDSLYGQGAGLVSQGVEMFTVRVHAVVRLQRPSQATEADFSPAIPDAARLGTREIFWPDRMQRLESPIYDGSRLHHGNHIEGPAIVELPFTSIPVGVDQVLECDAFGNFMLRLEAR